MPATIPQKAIPLIHTVFPTKVSAFSVLNPRLFVFLSSQLLALTRMVYGQASFKIYFSSGLFTHTLVISRYLLHLLTRVASK
jgi:hypothetical protein